MAQSESIYGHSMDPADVPKKISESIRTLPAEQMYSVMKEMKEVVMVKIQKSKLSRSTNLLNSE